MTTEGKDETDGLDPRDDEALWSLLGRHEPPAKASPYFARRVLREVALDEQPQGGWTARLRRFWTPTPRHTAVWSGAFALGMLCLSAVLTIPASHRPLVRSSTVAEATVAPTEPAPSAAATGSNRQETERFADAAPVQDEEIIADLDNLLNREESRLWTEDTDSGRF